MSVSKPTSADLARVAERIGFRPDDETIEEYTALVSAMLEAYDAVDTVDETPVLATRERVDSRFPTAGEDPNHTWYVRVSIRGAAEGALAGVRMAVKDSIMVAGVPMMNGADLLEGYTPTSTPPSSRACSPRVRRSSARPPASTSASPVAATPMPTGRRTTRTGTGGRPAARPAAAPSPWRPERRTWLWGPTRPAPSACRRPSRESSG